MVEDKSASSKGAPQPRDPRSWTHQDEFMLQLEGQRIENPLIYSKIQYPSHEWDNIPPVIPKFIIQLEKYMEGITSMLKTQSELETVAELRKWSENQVKVSHHFRLSSHVIMYRQSIMDWVTLLRSARS